MHARERSDRDMLLAAAPAVLLAGRKSSEC